MANALEQLDALIAETLSAWNIYSTLITVILSAFVLYPLVFWNEPDTHPLLLARQATASFVRYPRESAIYRSTEVPHGYPLKSGLNVRDSGAPKWSAGSDGDLRHVWREAARGPTADTPASAAAILTIRGKDAPVQHDLADISKAINVIGSHLKHKGAERVAIYLPNSVEYLTTIFACAFYGLSPVLLPYNQPHEVAYRLLNDTNVQALIASAGSLPLTDLATNVPSLSHVTWVVEPTSRHMDWSGAPDEAAGKLTVSVWHALVEEATTVGSDLPADDEATTPGDLVTVWQAKSGGPAKIVDFTQKNLVSAIAALISALPVRQRLGPSDLVLPADSFSHSYVLCLTLGALFSHSSLAINSVAGPIVDLQLAAQSVAPTVVIASSETLASIHAAHTSGLSSGLGKILHASQTRTLNAGRLPTDSFLSKFLAPKGTAIGSTPGKLRLIFASGRAGTESPTLSSAVLNDLRIATRARICYALTAPSVAGAVAQTHLYDYRHDDGPGHSHFGAPLSSVEIKLVDKDDTKVGGSTPSGEIVARGPAVSGGTSHLGVQGTIGEDFTLGYV